MVEVANDNVSWSNGRFFRTGLAIADVGGVQLVPVKVQTQYTVTQPLPRALSAHSSVVYRNRLFVVGGNTPYPPSPSNLVKSGGVFATTLGNPQSGALKPWESLPELPEPISDMATLAVEVGGRSFLVVLGGSRGRTNNLDSDLDQITSSKIHYYRLSENANGNLMPQSWTQAASFLPHQPDYDACYRNENNICDGFGSGARNLAAVSVNVAGTPYIYLFGGRNRVFDGNQYVDTYHSTVWKAPVSLSGNNLEIGTWQELPASSNIQYRKPDQSWQPVPLAGAAVTTFVDPLDDAVGVYLVGGANDNVTPDANVYIARIDANTGAVSWLPQGNMSDSRISHAAVQSDGTITASGGRGNANLPTTSLALGFINDEPSLTLYRDPLNPDAANFELNQGALLEARMLHRMETLEANEYGDWAYIIGGQVLESGGSVTPADDRVLFGNLDTEAVPGDTFVSNGKYYSKIFDFSDPDAQYFGIQWKAIIGASQNIEMSYRVGSTPQSMGPLTPIPGGSQNGNNSYTFPTAATGRFIQFVASLTSSAGTGSPTLDAVSLDVNRTGFPNIRVSTGTNAPRLTPNPISFGSPIALNMMIENQAFNAQNPAIDADWDAPGKNSFFVDLYATLTPAGATPPPPVFGQTESVAYVEVPKPIMKASQSYTIPSGNWKVNCPNTTCPQVNWHSIFNQEGTYTLYVMVDTASPAEYNREAPGSDLRLFGNVKEANESGTLGETDNVFGPFTVVVSSTSPSIYLPIATNRINSLQGAAQAPLVRQPRAHTFQGSR